jgi:spore coat protein U-like protein
VAIESVHYTVDSSATTDPATASMISAGSSDVLSYDVGAHLVPIQTPLGTMTGELVFQSDAPVSEPIDLKLSIPAGQNIAQGSYSDTVHVTVTLRAGDTSF